MGKLENDIQRKVQNEHFIKAFEYVARCLSLTQGALAEAIGSKSAYISNFRNGTRPVPDETIEGLIRVSARKPGLQIFSEYLYGYSDIMLLSNVTDEEMVGARMRHENPDYDVMKDKSTPMDTASETTGAPFIPSWADTLIDIMTQQIKQNEALNQELRQSITTVNSLIGKLSHLIINGQNK